MATSDYRSARACAVNPGTPTGVPLRLRGLTAQARPGEGAVVPINAEERHLALVYRGYSSLRTWWVN
jgi:hypothetical protein